MKILVVDDHSIFRAGVTALFEHAGHGAVVEQAAGVADALARLEAQEDFDVVLLDLNLPEGDGVAAIARMLQVRRDVKIVMLSASEDLKDVKRALAAGAVGYVPKSASAQTLLSAIEIVAAGDVFVPSVILSRGLSGGPSGPLLTARQVDVLKLVAQGMPNRSIAAELSLSEKTVKVHVTAIFKALDVVNRTQAAAAGQQAGLI
jgi:DNA-binding NarL/FixJ family response regulator